MKGDVGLTFTLDFGSTPVLVSSPRSGKGTQERNGRADQGKAATVTAPSAVANDGTEGHGGQENNGTVSTGRTGRIS